LLKERFVFFDQTTIRRQQDSAIMVFLNGIRLRFVTSHAAPGFFGDLATVDDQNA